MSIEILLSNPGEEQSRFRITEDPLPQELSNFFLEMSDPTVDKLEGVATRLIALPYEDLRHVQERLLNVTFESVLSKSLVSKGVDAEEANKMETGAMYLEQLVDRICDKFSIGTEPRTLYEGTNPRSIAEGVHERIQVRKAEAELRDGIKTVQEETDYKKRNRLAQSLKKRIFSFIERFNVTFHRKHERDELLEPTWKNLTSDFSWDSQLSLADSSFASWTLEEAIVAAHAASRRFLFENRFSKLRPFDKDEFEKLRLQFGAKAANLILLSNLTEAINTLRGRNYLFARLAVPELRAMSADTFDVWKESGNIDPYLLQVFEWVQTLKAEDRWGDEIDERSDFIVRSSAVFSEDRERATGAGIYESVKVQGNSTFQEFKDAVIRVYESTDSETAKSYRKQHGIESERMGLIIQKFKEPRGLFSVRGGKSATGYVNSRLQGVDDLMEIVTETSRNFIKRVKLDFVLALKDDMHEEAFREIHHFEPDIFKADEHMLVRIAQLALNVERIWGQNVQIEFVADGLTIYFVQVRQIPTGSREQLPKIEFPDIKPVHTGSAIGIGDMELKVLSRKNYNREQTGMVIFPSNHEFTFRESIDSLPKNGAIIIADPEGRSGHIQTLCAELGLICVFPGTGDYEKPTMTYHELLNLDKIRVVSDGIEGRIYEID